EPRPHGDLSENAEYDAAREEQSFIEGRIAQLNGDLSHAEVINPATLSKSGKVVFGCVVTLLDIEKDTEVCYQIVGNLEADISKDQVSLNSPIARALLGHKVEDEVDVHTPGGLRQYEVLEIRY
ncbi:MAG TPA: transcription elongation factor GreA, partial [Gammaproteobacteria bacterium]|nr:transcription elongation factor GreA [Gammaproteobacteria bacterium]